MKEELKVELFGEKDTEELEQLFKVVWRDDCKSKICKCSNEVWHPKNPKDFCGLENRRFSNVAKYPSKWLEIRRYSKEKILAEMDEGYNYFGVRKDGRIVGCYKAIITEEGCFGEQQSVLPEYRGLGAADAMYEQFIKFAEDKGCERNYMNILVDDTVCEYIIERYGFEKWGEPYEQIGGMFVQMYERRVR
ncbi:MAG: Acetyltransferase (GNAT) family protein [Candidatus Methanolliviera sp. GoM_oil]|nr:MAG: Acetyltransferase (GNAT) family protein [Candidatus Methanolliviera sp. GoM_oil]